jgi:hypothetical protein
MSAEISIPIYQDRISFPCKAKSGINMAHCKKILHTAKHPMAYHGMAQYWIWMFCA